MKFIIFQILPITILIFVGCTKGEIVPNMTNSVEGVYIGNTNQIHKWANSIQGYNERDTIFIDTFFVTIVANDSIIFMNKGMEWKFKLDTTNYYLEWYGSHSNREFEINEYDSLSVNYWSYGGFGDNFSQTNKNFNGVKQ